MTTTSGQCRSRPRPGPRVVEAETKCVRNQGQGCWRPGVLKAKAKRVEAKANAFSRQRLSEAKAKSVQGQGQGQGCWRQRPRPEIFVLENCSRGRGQFSRTSSLLDIDDTDDQEQTSRNYRTQSHCTIYISVVGDVASTQRSTATG